MRNTILLKTGMTGLLLALMLLWVHVPAHSENPEQVLVIANKKFTATQVSAADIARIFKKEITAYHGIAVKPIHAPSHSLLRREFVTQVLKTTEAAELKYWQDMKIKKGMAPPVELSSTTRAVFAVPEAISYCFRKDYNPAVSKIIFTP